MSNIGTSIKIKTGQFEVGQVFFEKSRQKTVTQKNTEKWCWFKRQNTLVDTGGSLVSKWANTGQYSRGGSGRLRPKQ